MASTVGLLSATKHPLLLLLLSLSVFEKFDLPGLSCRPKHTHFPLHGFIGLWESVQSIDQCPCFVVRSYEIIDLGCFFPREIQREDISEPVVSFEIH